MTPEELFEEKQYLVFAAIKQQFGSIARATQIAALNNMELDDVIQVGHMYLWERCLKYNPARANTFNGYVMKGMKWAMSNELHTKGRTIRVSKNVSPEERNRLNFHSIDLCIEGETENEYFAVASINVEEEAMIAIEFQEVMSVLNPEEKFILQRKSNGFSDDEIGQEVGRSLSYVNKRKNRAFLKINPEYVPFKGVSPITPSRMVKNTCANR